MDSYSFGYLTNIYCISTLCQISCLWRKNSSLWTLLTFLTLGVSHLWSGLEKLPNACHLDLVFQTACRPSACYPHFLCYWYWLSCSFLSFFFFFFFCLFWATFMACRGSQARGPIGGWAARLHHSSWQGRILNPVSEARGQTCNLMVASQICFHRATMGSLKFSFTFSSKALPNWFLTLPHTVTGCVCCGGCEFFGFWFGAFFFFFEQRNVYCRRRQGE